MWLELWLEVWPDCWTADTELQLPEQPHEPWLRQLTLAL